MGCNCGCVSTLVSQEVGSAYYYVRLVADNLQLLQDLAARMEAADPGEVINILRGTTSVLSNGLITSDPDNSHIAVTAEAGLTDDLTTIDGDPDGRVIVIRPTDGNTITLKAIKQLAIVSTDPAINEFTVNAHGLVTGELIGLEGPGLAVDVAPGAYYAIATGANTFKIATSKANAMAGTVVEIINPGTGFLDIGNLKIGSDLVLSGRESAMFVKDGVNYTLLGSSSVLPAVTTMLNSELATKQDLNSVLTALSELVLAGEAGKFIEINATGDGFQIVDYGMTQLTADLAAKADLNHTHTVAEVTGLQADLDNKSDVGHIHDDRYYTTAEVDAKFAAEPKHTISTLAPSGGADGDIWFKVA